MDCHSLRAFAAADMASCSLEKLQIQGFRSFGPQDEDSQVGNYSAYNDTFFMLLSTCIYIF